MLVAKAGSKVIIHGLKNSPEYNGKCGRVVSILPDSKLVVVLDCDDADEKKELKISGQNVAVAPTSSEFFRGGSQLQQNGQHVEALPMFHECLRTAMDDGDLNMACAALIGAAQSCFDLKRYDEAITNFRACLKTSEDSGNVAGQAETLMNIGSVYMEQGLSRFACSHTQFLCPNRYDVSSPSSMSQ